MKNNTAQCLRDGNKRVIISFGKWRAVKKRPEKDWQYFTFAVSRERSIGWENFSFEDRFRDPENPPFMNHALTSGGSFRDYEMPL